MEKALLAFAFLLLSLFALASAQANDTSSGSGSGSGNGTIPGEIYMLVILNCTARKDLFCVYLTCRDGEELQRSEVQ